MSQAFTITGGARIGWINATWPLARLSATRDTLTVSASLLGSYSFAPDQVSAVERYGVIPVLGCGVRIHHCRTDYPQRIVFWCLGNPERVLHRIREAGFLPTAPSYAIPQRRGIPLRWSAILFAVAVWNALLWIESTRSAGPPSQPGPLAVGALLFAFTLSVGTLTSTNVQRLILKPGRSVGEVRPFLRLLAFISGTMLIVLLIILFQTGR